VEAGPQADRAELGPVRVDGDGCGCGDDSEGEAGDAGGVVVGLRCGGPAASQITPQNIFSQVSLYLSTLKSLCIYLHRLKRKYARGQRLAFGLHALRF
jgi:hypothetical protein